ncbi:MAG: sigma-70 family RNA polymerase sigma factor [Nitrospinaceae bacterium]
MLDCDQWVDRYGDMLYRYTLVRVKDADAAEEIVQIALVAALQAQNSFQGRASEKSWLFGILKHKILDHFRQVKQRRNFEVLAEDDQDPYENAFDAAGHWVHPPRQWTLDPEKAAENNELTEALTHCLHHLSEKFRTIFVFKEIEGWPSEDICNEFNIKPTNLWVILHRARNQLKKCLEQLNIKEISG